MPRRNRVDPWGRLIETAARGAWLGNRGCLHDASGRITDRAPPADAWIVCKLQFKGRRRSLLQPGRYTELFFLDEATALAAGHRPCGECRRHDLRRFGAAWPGAGARGFASAPEIDAALRRERRDLGDPRRRVVLEPGHAPADGLIFALGGRDTENLVLGAGGRLWPWSPSGYARPLPWARPRQALMLTPPSTAAAIGNGYRVQVDPSALG